MNSREVYEDVWRPLLLILSAVACTVVAGYLLARVSILLGVVIMIVALIMALIAWNDKWHGSV